MFRSDRKIYMSPKDEKTEEMEIGREDGTVLTPFDSVPRMATVYAAEAISGKRRSITAWKLYSMKPMDRCVELCSCNQLSVVSDQGHSA